MMFRIRSAQLKWVTVCLGVGFSQGKKKKKEKEKVKKKNMGVVLWKVRASFCRSVTELI